MSDKVHQDISHHDECLRLINDLHDLLRLAESSQFDFNTGSTEIRDAFEWKFWADQCADVLQIRM